ncbi:unnamed protein product [Dovyalis caffra]|uniref:Gag-pol polyprotein n=1 Tax=Dovyalis caffra TaxID=77055 RepID=A0AAV1R7Q6_9ROSI|nr:unnamed protein product [Dovyalis caffra]
MQSLTCPPPCLERETLPSQQNHPTQVCALESLIRQITEMFQAFQAREKSSINQPGPIQRHANGDRTNGNLAPKLVKLDFPCDNRVENPTLWISRVKQFFDFQSIAPEE